ncbi:hypothetical protein B5S33_g2757 [[Candida] boidinii]|nr:hypothetical protein B5S27_g4717 [[Candida] boidinii]OWB84117.1 hypothetical protein B5S33_g2757 [[Candida] boidinii]
MMESPGRYRDKSPIRKDNGRPSSSTASPYRDRENSPRPAATTTTQHTHYTKAKDMAADQFWDGVIDIPNCDWIYTMDELKRKTPSRTTQAENRRGQDQQAVLALEGQADQVRGEAVRGAVLRGARGEPVQALHRGSAPGAPRDRTAVQ